MIVLLITSSCSLFVFFTSSSYINYKYIIYNNVAPSLPVIPHLQSEVGGLSPNFDNVFRMSSFVVILAGVIG